MTYQVFGVSTESLSIHQLSDTGSLQNMGTSVLQWWSLWCQHKSMFIIFPTVLLILYSMRLFRRCVSCCGFQRYHALHMFVESFLNGTGSSCDFKGASASLLILRILILVNTLTARSTVRVLLGLTSYYLSDKLVFNAWLQVIGNTCRPALKQSFRLQFTHSPTGA